MAKRLKAGEIDYAARSGQSSLEGDQGGRRSGVSSLGGDEQGRRSGVSSLEGEQGASKQVCFQLEENSPNKGRRQP